MATGQLGPVCDLFVIVILGILLFRLKSQYTSKDERTNLGYLLSPIHTSHTPSLQVKVIIHLPFDPDPVAFTCDSRLPMICMHACEWCISMWVGLVMVCVYVCVHAHVYGHEWIHFVHVCVCVSETQKRLTQRNVVMMPGEGNESVWPACCGRLDASSRQWKPHVPPLALNSRERDWLCMCACQCVFACQCVCMCNCVCVCVRMRCV